MTVAADSLPTVLASAPVEALGAQVKGAAARLRDGAEIADSHWGRLEEVFQLSGVDGVRQMLGPSVVAADYFYMAMESAQRALSDAASTTFPELERRRNQLASRIDEVNRSAEGARSAAAEAESAYWVAYNDDPHSETTTRARAERVTALHTNSRAASEESELIAEIERLRRDVEAAEEALASRLRGIADGDVVVGAWGEEVGISQDYWGAANAPYPGGPSATTGLEGRLTRALSDSASRRISWMARTDADNVRAWVEKHPDFASAVGMVEPDRARRLWNELASTSLRVEDSVTASDSGVLAQFRAPDSGSAWQSGALAHLFAVAPFAVGNLNGVAAKERDRFNRESLRQMRERDDLSAAHREQLGELSELLNSNETRPQLLSLFQDSDDASPRASVGWGELDDADEIMTLSHGINEDLGSLGPWAESAARMHEAVSGALHDRDSAATTGVVLFMEWDSGDALNVQEIARPSNGAERLTHLLRGFEANAPGVQLDVGLHSLGTTMGTQMIADNPRLVSNAWLYGSAGINGQTAYELEKQIDGGRGPLTVHATYAQGSGFPADDFVAPLGRMGEHPVDPDDIPEVKSFSSAAGPVWGVDENGERTLVGHGERTEGHNSQRSDEWYYRYEGTRTDHITHEPSIVWDDEAVGYLDPASRSFRQTVQELADSIQRRADGDPRR